MKKKKKKSPFMTFLLILLILLALGMIGTGIYLVFFKNRDAFDRQSSERSLAEEYIDDLFLQLDDPDAYARKIEERRKRLKELESERSASDLETEAESAEYETETEVQTECETEYETELVTDEFGNESMQKVKVIKVYRTLRTNRVLRDRDGNTISRIAGGYEQVGDEEYETEYGTESYIDENGVQQVRRVKKLIITRRLRAASVSRINRKTAGTDKYAYEDYEDPNYYSRDGVVYTPDYAKGYLDCVLEVPTAGIKRGVYAGTWQDIWDNLDIWMVTAARPDYVLGETRYCIYGHNHTVQDLSFNKLQKVNVGEYFYLTGDSGRYVYKITNVFAVSRDDALVQYVDNASIGSDKCYLITCGRNDGVRNFRYLDLMVEGTLEEHLTLAQYKRILNK